MSDNPSSRLAADSRSTAGGVAQAVALLEALAKLLPGLAVLAALWLFHGDISEFLRRTKSFKGVGLELQAFDVNVKAAAKVNGLDPAAGESLETKAIWAKFERLAAVLPSVRILWVDERPENNFAVRRNMTRYGIRVDIAQSNEEALAAIRQRDYDMIISDVYRPDAPGAGAVAGPARGGVELARRVRALGYDAPLLFYSAHYKDLPESVDRAIATNRPAELLDKVADTIAAMFPDEPVAQAQGAPGRRA